MYGAQHARLGIQNKAGETYAHVSNYDRLERALSDLWAFNTIRFAPIFHCDTGFLNRFLWHTHLISVATFSNSYEIHEIRAIGQEMPIEKDRRDLSETGCAKGLLEALCISYSIRLWNLIGYVVTEVVGE